MSYSEIVSSALHPNLPRAAVAAAIGLGGFAAGVAATELGHRRAASEPAGVAPPTTTVTTPARLEPPDAGAPRILFDPASITLLPDASLELALPPGFDAGR